MSTHPRSLRVLLVTALVSVVTALGSSWLLRAGLVSGDARVAVALAPVPFFALFVWAEAAWIRRADEFHRKVLLDSLAIAFPAAILLAVTVESLQKAGLATGWTIGDLWPWMGMLWVPAIAIAYRRYR